MQINDSSLGIGSVTDRNCPNFFATPYIISGTCKATVFKFGSYIQRVPLTKSPLKRGRKVSVGVVRDTPKFLGYPLLSQERVKLRTLVRTFTESIGTKAHQKMCEK